MATSTELQTPWRLYLVEFVGTFALVLLTSGAICAGSVAQLAGHSEYGRVGIALIAGAVWAVTLAFTLRISGGYLNPAITITMWVFQRLDNRRAAGLIVAQMLGSLLAGVDLRGLLFASEAVLASSRLGTPHLNAIEIDRTAMLTGIGIEAVLTFLLVFALFAFIHDPRFRRTAGDGVYRLTYLWLGLLVFVEVMVGFELTGASMNPARWFGTAVWELTVEDLRARGPFLDHGPFWIGPILGSLLAGMVYSYLVLPDGLPKGPPTDGMP